VPIAAFETLEVTDQREWQSWLNKNHLKSQGVWLVFQRKSTGRSSPTYEEALGWALAYGWIDSLIKKIDDSRYARKFTPRKPWSIWSTPNINRVKRLKLEGKMTRWGLEAFEMRTSKRSLLEQFRDKEVQIPKDLEKALRANPRAWTNFQKFSSSYRKRYSMWISAAKRSGTRQRRISEAVELISRNVKALLK
jgi:uncharacterized protein YdeI (YjbR/CyaY-like superfamily)